jgi:DNA-binding transcriptional ArsR family regulator
MNELDSAFFALSDPTRRAILARLATGELTVMELAEPFEMSQPAISRHLKVLEDARLISRRVEGTTRPCRLEADGMRGVEQWLAMMREALSRNYTRLDTVLASMQAESRRAKPARPDKHKQTRRRSTRS